MLTINPFTDLASTVPVSFLQFFVPSPTPQIIKKHMEKISKRAQKDVRKVGLKNAPVLGVGDGPKKDHANII